MTRTTIRVCDDPRRRRRSTPGAFSYSLKQIAVACVLSGLIAGAVTALTTESMAGNGPASVFPLNWMGKVVRLPPAPGMQTSGGNATSAPVQHIEGRVPVGCDRAFSPVADPARANFVRHCLT